MNSQLIEYKRPPPMTEKDKQNLALLYKEYEGREDTMWLIEHKKKYPKFHEENAEKIDRMTRTMNNVFKMYMDDVKDTPEFKEFLSNPKKLLQSAIDAHKPVKVTFLNEGQSIHELAGGGQHGGGFWDKIPKKVKIAGIAIGTAAVCVGGAIFVSSQLDRVSAFEGHRSVTGIQDHSDLAWDDNALQTSGDFLWPKDQWTEWADFLDAWGMGAINQVFQEGASLMKCAPGAFRELNDRRDDMQRALNQHREAAGWMELGGDALAGAGNFIWNLAGNEGEVLNDDARAGLAAGVRGVARAQQNVIEGELDGLDADIQECQRTQEILIQLWQQNRGGAIASVALLKGITWLSEMIAALALCARTVYGVGLGYATFKLAESGFSEEGYNEFGGNVHALANRIARRGDAVAGRLEDISNNPQVQELVEAGFGALALNQKLEDNARATERDKESRRHDRTMRYLDDTSRDAKTFGKGLQSVAEEKIIAPREAAKAEKVKKETDALALAQKVAADKKKIKDSGWKLSEVEVRSGENAGKMQKFWAKRNPDVSADNKNWIHMVEFGDDPETSILKLIAGPVQAGSKRKKTSKKKKKSSKKKTKKKKSSKKKTKKR